MPKENKQTEEDFKYMKRALELARRAREEGEVPVGAVVVKTDEFVGDGCVIGAGLTIAEAWNCPIAACDPTAHAEILALRGAAATNQNYRLPGCTIYVTLEPCVMCAGAIVAARIKRLVFAARDIRFGGVRSLYRLADSDLQNHRVHVEEGLMAAEAAELMREFFKARRD